MTIHRRRGSGYGHYWLGIALGLCGVVAVVVLASSGRLAFDGARSVASVGAVAAVLAVSWAVTRRRG